MWALIIQNYIIPFSKWILKMLSIRMLWNISERKSEVQKELSWWINSYQLKVFIGLQADVISLFETDSQQTEECSVAQQRYLRWQDIFLCYQFICAYVQAWSMICIVFVSVSLLIKRVLPENLKIPRICIHYRETCSLPTCYGYVLPEGSQRKQEPSEGCTHLDALWSRASPKSWHAWWSCKTPGSGNPCNSKWAWSSLLWQIMNA